MAMIKNAYLKIWCISVANKLALSSQAPIKPIWILRHSLNYVTLMSTISMCARYFVSSRDKYNLKHLVLLHRIQISFGICWKKIFGHFTCRELVKCWNVPRELLNAFIWFYISFFPISQPSLDCTSTVCASVCIYFRCHLCGNIKKCQWNGLLTFVSKTIALSTNC